MEERFLVDIVARTKRNMKRADRLNPKKGPTTTYTAWSDIPTATSVDVIDLTLTRTYFNTPSPLRGTRTSTAPASTATDSNISESPNISTHIASIEFSFTTAASTSPSAATSNPSPAANSSGAANGLIEPPQKAFPTALVAIIVSLFTFALLAGLIVIFVRRRRRNNTPPPSTSHPETKDKSFWAPLAMLRWRDRNKEFQPVLDKPQSPDPVAVAIAAEERERLRRAKRSGEASFYAPGVRHLVVQDGSKEKLKIDINRRRG